MKTKIIISCEHGGNIIPSYAQKEIKISQKVLESHRGYDKGALKIAQALAKSLKVIPVISTVTRLAIDYNRSLSNKDVWSSYSRNISNETKKKLALDHEKYRDKIKKELTDHIFHLSIHSFTPVLRGNKRNADFGILYDPTRLREKEFAKKLKKELMSVGIKTRLNYPYLGKTDGIATFCRKIRGGDSYMGFEMEFNQAIVNDSHKVERILEALLNMTP